MTHIRTNCPDLAIDGCMQCTAPATVRAAQGDDSAYRPTPQEKSIDVPALTQMLGLPAHEQGAVASWSGEEPADMYRTDGTAKPCWTAEEAAELVRLWHAQYADDIENGR